MEPRSPRPRLRAVLAAWRDRLAVLAVAAAVLAACAAGAAPTATTTSPVPSGPSVTPTPVPGAPGAGGIGGIGAPVDPNKDPLLGPAKFYVPQPGQLDPHPVNVQRIRTAVDGRHVQVELRWWSGVPPCSVLDSVTVAMADDTRTIALTVNEGAGGRGVACIDIAQLTGTIVDLGDLAPGQWTISAAGDAPPVSIEVD